MGKHEILLHRKKDHDTAMEGIQNIHGIKCHVRFDPHGLDGCGHMFVENCPFMEIGEILIDADDPLNIELKYTFENSEEIYDLDMHRGGDHYSAIIDPTKITGDLILVY